MPKEILSGKTILVTGGTGSIGSEIVRQALDHDAGAVVVFSRDEIKHFVMKKRIPDERLKMVTGDVRDGVFTFGTSEQALRVLGLVARVFLL